MKLHECTYYKCQPRVKLNMQSWHCKALCTTTYLNLEQLYLQFGNYETIRKKKVSKPLSDIQCRADDFGENHSLPCGYTRGVLDTWRFSVCDL